MTDSSGGSDDDFDPEVNILSLENSVDMEELATVDHTAAVNIETAPSINLAAIAGPSEVDTDCNDRSFQPPELQPAAPQHVAPPGDTPISYINSLNCLNSFRPPPVDSSFAMPNCQTPPPSMPAHYASILFPRLEPCMGCPSMTLSAISNNYLERERAAFKGTRLEGEFVKLYDSRDKGRPFCKWCSEYGADPTPTWHRHFSSKMSRLAANMDHLARYNCNQCSSSPHYAFTGSRTRVLLTSSTLDDYWGIKAGLRYSGDSLHLDCIRIPGGTIKDLKRAFQAEFSTHPPTT